MESSTSSDSDLDSRLHRAEVVADIAQRALVADDLDRILEEATAAVVDILECGYCGAYEVGPDGARARLRVANGELTAADGEETAEAGEDSLAGEVLDQEAPVVVGDLAADDRFGQTPALFAERDPAAAVGVRIGPMEDPWGMLCAFATVPSAFTEADVGFLQQVGDVVSSAVETAPVEGDPIEAEREEMYGRISDAFFALDEEWRFTYLNDRAHELINPEDERLVGEIVWEAFPEAVGRSFEAQYKQAMYEQETVSFEEYYPEPLNAWFEVRAYPSESGLSVYFRDVTSRKERERELERFEILFEESTDVNAVLNADGTYQYLPPSVEKVLGYEAADLEGEHAYEYVHPDDREDVAAAFERIVENPSCQPTIEFRYKHADGSWRWLEVSARNLLEDDRVEGIVVYTRDITERKDRERELERRKRRFEAIFEDPNILVGLLEPDGTVLDINETAMEYIDADLSDVTGVPFWETPWWGEGNGVRADVREWTERAADGEYVDFQVDLTRPDGQQYTLEGFFRPVTNDDGEVVSIVVSDRDVTDRREYERQLWESERRYRTLAEHFPNGIVTLFDEDLRYTLAAGQAFDYLPVSRDDLEGQTARETWGSRVADDLEPVLRDALDGDEGAVEVSYAGREWVVHAVPIADEDGAVYAGMTMAQDITERNEYERRLEDSERRYRTLAEHFPNGAVGIYDEDLRYTLAEGIKLGDALPPADTLEGNRMPDIFPEETAEDLEPVFRAAVEDGVTDSTRAQFGGRHWRVWATPLQDDSGEVFRGLSFAQDVTEQVEREQRLERFETIVETVDDGVYVVDQDGYFTMVNEAYSELVGYSRDELIGMHVSTVVDDETVQAAADLQTAMEDDRVDEPALEAELLTADGERVPTEGRFALLPENDEWRRVGVVRDISDRKERERRLAESERRYRTLVENFPNGSVGLFDDNLEYTVVGGELLDEVGVDATGRVGNTLSDIYPEELVEEVEPRFEAALEGETNAFEVEFYDRQLYAHTLPVDNADGEIFAGMLVVQDVTERREYERKLEASNERLEQFAYAASHDLQEPLRMVSSYLQLIERRYADELDDEGEEFIDFAVDGAERMREMIEALLAYSRVETRGEPFEPVDLGDVLADVRDDVQVKIEETNATVTDESLPTIEGDRSQLRQVLQNLLENALEYSGDDPPHVHVDAERHGDRWVIRVTDEGIGIHPENEERIFEVFERLHSREEYPGTGIGLALAQRIVERHDGRIWVDSEPGEGSTFHVSLPVASDVDA